METFIYLALLIVSLVASLYFLRIYKLAGSSYDWPKVTGKIKSVKTSSHSGSGDTHTSWFCKVMYSYQVGDKAYSGNRINFSHVFVHSDYALSEIVKLEEKFKAQAEVDVFYKESEPGLSVLEPGCDTNLKYILAASIILSLIFLIGLLNSILHQ